MPNFGHSQAAETVCAVLMRALRARGHEISFATVATGRGTDPETMAQLAGDGIRYLGDFTNAIEAEDPVDRLPRGRRWLAYLHEVARPAAAVDYPRFRRPQETAAALAASGADVALLFWDSWFEHLLPALDGLPVAAYLGRPRMESSLVRLSGQPATPRNMLMRRRLLGRRQRHLRRAGRLRGAANICALDAAWYRSRGLPCRYVPNCWPDAFGEEWRARRMAAEKARGEGAILGNIGHVATTGNDYGLTWMGEQVLPSLPDAGGWRVNVCGSGNLSPRAAAALGGPRVIQRGFVSDIDDEMLSNQVFLVCNNAGPYTGGYTRICYAMSSGATVVAHRRLAQSMPEVVHGENALLGDSGAEVANLVAGALADPGQRARIGAAARATYEARYAPAAVAEALEPVLDEAAA